MVMGLSIGARRGYQVGLLGQLSIQVESPSIDAAVIMYERQRVQANLQEIM